MVRIGDRERDQATECLREHMATGRLDQAEFEQRIEAALSARYADDLRPLFIDLPAPRPELPTVRREQAAHRGAAPVPQPAPAPPPRSPFTGWRAATTVAWTVAIIACVVSGLHLWWLLFIPLVMGGGCGGRRSRHVHQRRLAEQQLRWEPSDRRFDGTARRLENRHW